MSFDNFIGSLTDEQKAALMKDVAASMTVAPEPDAERIETITIAPTNPTPKRAKVNNDFSVDRGEDPKMKTPVEAKRNTWVDTGEERDPDYDAAEAEAKYKKIGVADRSRPAPIRSQLKCHVCAKQFEVDSSSVYGSFPRCDNCISGG